jgi:putative membrane protein
LDKRARKEKNKMMGMMGFGLIIPLLVIGGIAYALGWRPQFNPGGPAQTGQTPLELLKARFARGEISREEYEQMRRDLEA